MCSLIGYFRAILPFRVKKIISSPYVESSTSKELNNWRRHPDSNWGMKVLQTSALPLGYVAINYILCHLNKNW